MYSVKTETFLEAYKNGDMDLEVIERRMQNIRKKEKRIYFNG